MRDVSMSYNFEGHSFKALDTFNLSIEKGEFVSIIGPSGCGKSTLFSIVSGLVRPTEGSVEVDGKTIDGPRPDKIAVVLQEVSLFPWRNVMKNVEFGMEIVGIPQKQREATALNLLKLLGLQGFEMKYPQQLSGGMRQRVSIARALAMNTELLLMDEPFGALDEQTRRIMGEELLKIWSTTRKTVLFVTHSLEEAVMLSDRIVVMSARPGRILDIVKVDMSRPRKPASMQFSSLKEDLWNLLRTESMKSLAT
ncbi:MAG: ABC transporter ATP-binding protein [Nitrososphaerota archaeon]|nr:ABC transporter ATP-binding protein [Nitrososphaerota archaeon]